MTSRWIKFDCCARSVRIRGTTSCGDSVAADPKLGVFAVADGISGRPGASMASRMALEILVKHVGLAPPARRMDASLLHRIADEANSTIYAAAQADPMLSGMGTTLSGVILRGLEGVIIHVGDSRVYLFREGILSRLTRDHTLVEELVERNHLTREQAATHPLRNVLSQSLGTRPKMEADLIPLSLQPNDLLLPVTDGLTKAIEHERIEKILHMEAPDAETICRRLVDAAALQSPRDDISLVVIRILQEAHKPKS